MKRSAIILVCMSAGWAASAWFGERVEIVSDSMAPTLHGPHRDVVCSKCGGTSRITQSPNLCKSWCPHCFATPLPIAQSRSYPGDRIWVDRTACRFTSIRRYDVVVFNRFGRRIVKRVLGLPGEKITIVDGDIFIDEHRLRKSHLEAKALSVPFIEPEGAHNGIWVSEAGETFHEFIPPNKSALFLPFGNQVPKCQPICDEYAYNLGHVGNPEPVHDFWVEMTVTAEGNGTWSLGLFDGVDWAEQSWPIAGLKMHRLKMGFVDRRLTLALDRHPIMTRDYPEPEEPRDVVVAPLRIQTAGVTIRLTRMRLLRDIHYGQRGIHGVHGKSVLLGMDQYFVLGDNSSQSEDSRHWSNSGIVERKEILGLVGGVR